MKSRLSWDIWATAESGSDSQNCAAPSLRSANSKFCEKRTKYGALLRKLARKPRRHHSSRLDDDLGTPQRVWSSEPLRIYVIPTRNGESVGPKTTETDSVVR